jgi:hypothetical protein
MSLCPRRAKKKRGGTGWEQRIPLINDLLACTSYENASAWLANRPECSSYGFTKQAVNGYCAAKAPNLLQPGFVSTPPNRAL